MGNLKPSCNNVPCKRYRSPAPRLLAACLKMQAKLLPIESVAGAVGGVRVKFHKSFGLILSS
jgi:hypothetical protein